MSISLWSPWPYFINLLLPLPPEYQLSMSYAGSCAEVVTDVGTKFAGEFAELLRQHFVEHCTSLPNHPRADGLAERAV